MRNFSGETARKILVDEINVETLLKLYPDYQEEVLQEIKALKNSDKPNFIKAILDKYTYSAKIAKNKISTSGMNERTIKVFLPDIIKARLAFYLLEQLNVIASSNTTNNSVRFNLWDGTILQKLLFRRGFERKPVSVRVFRIFWRLIINKRVLLPLVNQKGIYCFYSKELIKELSVLIGEKSCVEIGAGDGTLTAFLNKQQLLECRATDDYSWKHYITYPDFVEKADSKTALNKYQPKAVICSWPVPKNTYERHVFQSDSVDLYIVIGTKNATYTGDFETYYNQQCFSMELDEHLSSLILPPSDENAVYIFRRLKK
ncbi:SAM-dependent methyltransferase [Paenibacillus sp. CAA11]|uniref:SAM-dependent methyltransferase n=1 Tax=Paenibacillus sp. CAA11 TaxID=1532905 RepID=UPI000D353BBC|nr:SAM-dependent methyltransferase [Paenibacillus sp. CAA11]AWB44718.1 SAM-dependent methyltransferase [Paenibacillus sp. CAA11]